MKQKLTDNTALLISVSEVSKLLGICPATFYNLQAMGRIGPTAIKMGRRSLFRRAEIEAWILDDCPNRNKWFWNKAAVAS